MRITNPPPEQFKEWEAWVESRPPIIKEIAKKFDPWTLYSGPAESQLCTVCAISEDETVRVTVWGRTDGFDILYPRGVFGVDPNKLHPAPSGTCIPQSLQKEIDQRIGEYNVNQN